MPTISAKIVPRTHKSEKFYCVKCKAVRMSSTYAKHMAKNHRQYIQTKCNVCGTKMIRFI